ncbi:NADH-ubiquinone oxidoreductase-F iron-sulfur binding region domain-containing protein [Halorussus salinisoli]|uniref:NADH-ubiquinone oxidoreductase-F iron-sulfur binding region domain-containing protein n=1 Tax=Halorussus salinisoli TaxID=2558242 RepID=UPI0010C1D4D4|nr:NADH-ubiquinone oxidoreductase-F iron-sulfur binding region domain-containing protein [Halorussus salinisoli]
MTNVTGAVGRSPVVRVSADVTAARGDRVFNAARDVADSIPVVRTGPTGILALEPLVLATEGERTTFFASPRPSTVRDLVEDFESEGLPTDDADAVVEHDPEVASLPVPSDGPLSVGERRTLGPCGWVDPLDPTEHTLVSTERDVGSVADVGLLGRGRGDAAADEPIGETWERARGTDGEPVVVVNANESDDRPRADRTLLAGSPLSVLDGVAAVAEYVDAEDVVLYLNETDTELQKHVRRAVEAAEDELPVVPQIVAGPDEYRAGAPTAALEALEGADRIEPRVQPPTPAEHGLYGRPTVVHTPRTFAHVRHALRNPETFDADDADPGTRLVTVTGDVDAAATVELGSGGSLSDVGDAVVMDGSFKMACVGGVFGGITSELDVPPTAQSLDAANLGTDGVVELLSDERCAVATVGERARFASTANSGRCVPGREGTKQLTELLREIYQGAFRTDDIRELGRVMRKTSNCRIGAHAPRPVTTAMDEFEPEFRAHADGRCPSSTCEEKL